ncbi:major facilitator superfamily, partial [Nannochloropsis gaditana CCMP526]
MGLLGALAAAQAVLKISFSHLPHALRRRFNRTCPLIEQLPRVKSPLRMSRDPRLGSTQAWWTNELAFTFLFFLNLLNYIDRGIIPGAAEEFSDFVAHSLGTSSPDLFVGLLQSAFIVGFSLAAIVFGHVIHYVAPFKMVGVGLVIWIIATALSGLAHHVASYYLLCIARMLSGVGEAGFQCVAPPFILDLGGDSGGRWVAVFYTAIPLGTAIGYPWGALFAGSPWTWAGGFWVASFLMLPFAVTCFLLPFTWRPERAPIEGDDVRTDGDLKIAAKKASRDKNGTDSAELHSVTRHDALLRHEQEVSVADAEAQFEARHMSLLREACVVLRRPVFLLNAFGYAANTGMMIGASTFSSKIMLDFGFFSSESSASSVFGIALSLAGLLGTPLGGVLVDRRHFHSEEAKLVFLLRQSTIFATLGCICSSLSCWIYQREVFLVFFVAGALLLFVCTASINMVTMLSVPPANRSFAIGLCTLIMHALGDVPSPIVVGAILDTLAPDCAADMKKDGKVSPECTAQVSQVRLTLFITCMWLLVAILCWGVGYVVARREYHRHHAAHRYLYLDCGSVEGEKMSRSG